MSIRERKHRLPESAYRGQKTVIFTACIEERRKAFVHPEIVGACVERLTSTLDQFQCIAPAYCFMPDHLHLVLFGRSSQSQVKRTMDRFKESSGAWLLENRPLFHWQQDYYDHVVRHGEDLAHQVRYVLANPVRGGLVDDWQDYPFSGSIGVDLVEYLHDVDEARKFGRS